MLNSPDYFFSNSIRPPCVFHRLAVRSAAPHFSADHSAAACEKFQYHTAFMALALPLGIRCLRFPSALSPLQMGNQTIVVCDAPSAQLPWSLTFPIVSELSATLRIYHRAFKATPPVATLGRATGCWGPGWGKLDWLCDAEGMNNIISSRIHKRTLPEILFFFLHIGWVSGG